MATKMIVGPKFSLMQWVSFVGGTGVVRSYKSDTGSWTYLIEMPLGLAPNFGRVGAETMVLLNEADLSEIISQNAVKRRAA